MDKDNPWFENLFLNNPVPRFIFNLKSLKIENVNVAAVDQYGYSQSEFLSKTLYDLTPEEDVERLHEVISKLNDQELYIGDVRHLKKRGDLIWVQILVHPIPNNGSNVRLVQSLDISEKKKRELQLLQIQKRFQALIEHSEDIITVTDLKGKIMYVSPAFLKVTGFTYQELLNSPGRDFLPEDLYERLPAIKNELLASPEKTIPMVDRIKCSDGSIVYVEGTISNLLNEDAVQGIVSNFREITERIKAEEIIKQSEAILRAVFDSAAEGFAITDKNLIIQTFNKVAKSHVFYNTNRRQLEAGTSLLDYVSPERAEYFEGIIPRLMSGETFEYQTFDQHHGARWINYSLYPVENINKEIIGICIAGKDITEKIDFERKLKLSEQRYKALVREGSDLINIVDFDGNYKFISPSVRSTLNPQALGENAFQYVHEEDREKLKQELNLLHDSRRVKSSPYRFKTSGEQYIWLETVGTNLMDEPSVEGIVINSHDVTHTINHIKAIEERNTRLEEIAWIHAHLVRAPLASILGIIEIFKNSPSDFQEFMPYLEQSATQLDKVIGEITQKTNDLST